MNPTVTATESGLVVYNNGHKILLDPRRESLADVMFFSHAHTDHLITTARRKTLYSKKVLASKATSYLAQVRGTDLTPAECQECSEGYDLIDTCHVLGSRGLLIDNQIYYTADISTRKRGFMGSACIPKVDSLIVESTFGLPRYVFPPIEDIVHLTNKIIGEMFDKGVSVLLLGYPLGKAQMLTKLFQHWAPLYVHDSVAKINNVYRDFGVELKQGILFSDAKEQSLLEKSAPWVMIGPLGTSRSGYIKAIKQKYKAITVGFSGWAIDNSYKFMMGLDYALPLSDHCDYKELLQLVKSSCARKIYTFHGFSKEFAQSLRNLGFDAEPLTGAHRAREPSLHSAKNKTLDMYIQPQERS